MTSSPQIFCCSSAALALLSNILILVGPPPYLSFWYWFLDILVEFSMFWILTAIFMTAALRHAAATGVSGRGIGARAHSIKWCAPEDEDPQQFRGHNAPKDVFTFGLVRFRFNVAFWARIYNFLQLMYFLYTGNMDVDHSSPKHLPNRSFKSDTTHPAPPSQDFNCYQSVMYVLFCWNLWVFRSRILQS